MTNTHECFGELGPNCISAAGKKRKRGIRFLLAAEVHIGTGIVRNLMLILLDEKCFSAAHLPLGRKRGMSFLHVVEAHGCM